MASEHPAHRRRVLRLAGPVIGENLLETTLGIVDTVLVAGLGASATAGVGSAQQLMWFLICVLSALAVGSAVPVSDQHQRGQRAADPAQHSPANTPGGVPRS
jgi:Na+-driven multidrug efflux pump